MRRRRVETSRRVRQDGVLKRPSTARCASPASPVPSATLPLLPVAAAQQPCALDTGRRLGGLHCAPKQANQACHPAPSHQMQGQPFTKCKPLLKLLGVTNPSVSVQRVKSFHR